MFEKGLFTLYGGNREMPAAVDDCYREDKDRKSQKMCDELTVAIEATAKNQRHFDAILGIQEQSYKEGRNTGNVEE